MSNVFGLFNLHTDLRNLHHGLAVNGCLFCHEADGSSPAIPALTVQLRRHI
jgi:cytochrome c553